MPGLDDDLDWLYRRGSYDNQRSSTAGPPSAPGEKPADAGFRPDPLPPEPSASGLVFRKPRPRPPVRLPWRSSGPKQELTLGRRIKRVLKWVALVLALLLTYLIVVPIIAFNDVAKTPAVPLGEPSKDQPGTLILLAGSDSREGLTVKQTQELGTGTQGGNVSDTIMLLYVPTFGKPVLISIPRDSYVTVAGHGKQKINAAFAEGGPRLLGLTVETATGLTLDGYIGVGFGGFVNLVDAVGGVEQCLPNAIKDQNSHLDLKAGCQHMDGVLALKYVRMRYADPLGDLGRVQRQRSVLAAVVKKAASPLTWLNPFAYYHLNKTAAAAIKAGDNTNTLELATAALGFARIALGDGVTLTVPVSNPNLRTPSGLAVEWDSAQSRALFNMIASGDTTGIDQFVKK